MISFQKVFIESFIHNKPFDYKFEGDESFSFKDGDIEYIGSFERSNVDDYIRNYSKDEFIKRYLSYVDLYIFEFSKLSGYYGDHSLTNDTEYSTVRRVFATVEDIIVKFFETRESDIVYFTATNKEPKRVKFYKFLLKILQKHRNIQYLNFDMKYHSHSLVFNPRGNHMLAGKIIKYFEENRDTALKFFKSI